jgi:hypothetical protein
MRGIALSLRVQNNHVPILNDLFEGIIKATEGVEVYLDKEWRYKVAHMTPESERVAYVEHPGTIAELSQSLGVSPGAIFELRSEMAKVDLGMLLCWNHKYNDIMDALAVWDL